MPFSLFGKVDSLINADDWAFFMLAPFSWNLTSATQLPDVTFTNNLGSITFKRCLVGVTDSWEWAGRGVRHVKSVTISAHVQRNGTGEKLDGILTSRTEDGRKAGGLGVLTLPWTSLSNMKVVSLDWQEGTWIDYVPVTATFVDDTPYNNRYTFTLLGYTLYNPRITLPIPSQPIIDEFPQMPWTRSTARPYGPRAGTFRTRASERNMDVVVSGTIRTPDGQLPENLVQNLTMRAGWNNPLVNPGMAGGYPQPFNLGDAIPEVKDDLNLAHCIVTGGQIAWFVERDQARIDLQVLCPPQKPERT